MSTPSYKGPGQPIRSAQGGIADFVGGLFGGAAPSYKTTPTPPETAVTPAPSQAPLSTQSSAPAPTLLPVCVACPLAGLPMAPTERAPACPAPDDDPAEVVIPTSPGPITIVIPPRS